MKPHTCMIQASVAADLTQQCTNPGKLVTVATNISGSSVWNLLYVNLLASKTFRLLLDLQKMGVPLTSHFTHIHTQELKIVQDLSAYFRRHLSVQFRSVWEYEYEYIKGSGPHGPMHLGLKAGPLCPMSNQESPEALLKLQMAPRLILWMSLGSKKKEPRYVWVRPKPHIQYSWICAS